jgi:glycosyltransferase involved in cell wall biosynthesis
MRVLCLTNMYPSAADPVAGSFVRDQVGDLRELGVEVDVLAFDGREHSGEYARAAGRLRRRLRADVPDLVHAHYGLTGAVSLAQRRVPVVTTFHGSDVGYVRWQAPISWVVARRTTPIFVARRHAARLGLPDASVIPAGVDTGAFTIGVREEARRRLGWNDEGRYALLPGARANSVKGGELFDAVVGAVDQATGVELRGYSRAEVADVLNAVDVVLMTSVSEGSPVTIKEALACGTPVVSVRVGDVPDVIGELPGCSVHERDVASLAGGVREAFAATDRSALRRRALAYERLALARQVVSVYESVLS